jgi:hypothetical protein
MTYPGQCTLYDDAGLGTKIVDINSEKWRIESDSEKAKASVMKRAMTYPGQCT